MIELDKLPLVGNEELVARVIFPPKMIRNGHILPAAFVLRPSINEEYLSVLRISTPTFNADVKNIIYGRKRSFYGFAVLYTDEIHGVAYVSLVLIMSSHMQESLSFSMVSPLQVLCPLNSYLMGQRNAFFFLLCVSVLQSWPTKD